MKWHYWMLLSALLLVFYLFYMVRQSYTIVKSVYPPVITFTPSCVFFWSSVCGSCQSRITYFHIDIALHSIWTWSYVYWQHKRKTRNTIMFMTFSGHCIEIQFSVSWHSNCDSACFHIKFSLKFLKLFSQTFNTGHYMTEKL
jgi:hypothetical protein